VRLSYMRQVPGWFWMPNGSSGAQLHGVQCNKTRNGTVEDAGRRLSVAYVCDLAATTPLLSPPPADTDCDVNLTVRTASACFSFTWATGPWGNCTSGANGWTESRQVWCRETSFRSDSHDSSLCDAARKPHSTVECPAPAGSGRPLHGWPLFFLIFGVLTLCAALAVGTWMLITQHRQAVQRRRFLAMTQSYQSMPTSSDGGYYGLHDGTL